MLSCKDVTKKVASEEKLSLMQNIEIKMHLLICARCSFFVEQIKSLGQAAKKSFKVFQSENKIEIKELKKKIKENL